MGYLSPRTTDPVGIRPAYSDRADTEVFQVSSCPLFAETSESLCHAAPNQIHPSQTLARRDADSRYRSSASLLTAPKQCDVLISILFPLCIGTLSVIFCSRPASAFDSSRCAMLIAGTKRIHDSSSLPCRFFSLDQLARKIRSKARSSTSLFSCGLDAQTQPCFGN